MSYIQPTVMGVWTPTYDPNSRMICKSSSVNTPRFELLHSTVKRQSDYTTNISQDNFPI